MYERDALDERPSLRILGLMWNRSNLHAASPRRPTSRVFSCNKNTNTDDAMQNENGNAFVEERRTYDNENLIAPLYRKPPNRAHDKPESFIMTFEGMVVRPCLDTKGKAGTASGYKNIR